MGPIEVEFEGEESFLREELKDLLSSVSELYKESGIPAEGGESPPSPPPPGGSVQTTTGNIATKLPAKTAADLATAAAAHLTFVKGQGTFTRKELHEEMKTATGFYKSSYSGGNLTRSIRSLVSNNKFTETKKDTYALTASARNDLESKLGRS